MSLRLAASGPLSDAHTHRLKTTNTVTGAHSIIRHSTEQCQDSIIKGKYIYSNTVWLCKVRLCHLFCINPLLIFLLLSFISLFFLHAWQPNTKTIVVIHWFVMSHKATYDLKSGSANLIINWTRPKLRWFGGKQDYWWLELDFNDVNVITVLENYFRLLNGFSSPFLLFL